MDRSEDRYGVEGQFESSDRSMFGPREAELVEAVAVHERLSKEAARAKVGALLSQDWGPTAIRQMIRDEIDEAMSHSRWPDVDGLLDTYQWCCRNLPFGVERRQRRLH